MVELRVFATADGLARALARDVGRALGADDSLVLGLPAGRTPIPMYRELVRLHKRGGADFSRATIFGLDEFLGIAPRDPRSFQSFVRRHLLDHVNVKPRRAHFLNGTAADPAAECTQYERAIERAGGIDLLILGLGRNGHIGFNEPAKSLVGDTHRVTLTKATRQANAAPFDGRASAVPARALSMGVATIMRARRIVLVATGSGKARSVGQMLSPAVTPQFPASLLQLHSNAAVWMDRAAAARVTHD